jgi:energy-coupling factor transporter ATP-binding protein EcfA2
VKLKTINYWERFGTAREWALDGLVLGAVNLIVGRNATGKTRTLNLIWSLARMLGPEKHRVGNCRFEVTFEHDGSLIEYYLDVDKGKVYEEKVTVDGINRLERKLSDGRIFTEEAGKKMRFGPPENEIAALSRRDTIQHKFLEPLHDWAAGVRHYTFGATLGKETFAVENKDAGDPDERDSKQVVGIFAKGKRDFKEDFITAVLKDMHDMNYMIDDVFICVPPDIRIEAAGIPADIRAIGVKEKGVDAPVDQYQMSQGMFRALSILIQVNYSQLAKKTHCILIDDIGEGLDYDRSTRLIDILQSKAKTSLFQLIMASNDQFVMNHVPLTEWSVLHRDGNRVRVKNSINSKQQFEDFKFVGMTNFTFFELDFVNSPTVEEPAAHE